MPTHAQFVRLDRADGRAHEAQHRVAERIEHAAHDAVAVLVPHGFTAGASLFRVYWRQKYAYRLSRKSVAVTVDIGA
ncbi:hypothetical protein [Streptomyces sp. NPDC048521]|uniref:hypothetical protein n=1 Tax=Streptomyces sp. NPDC048521 TaxID=3365566 RepID=UPI0037168301